MKLVLLSVLALAIVGCGGGDDNPPVVSHTPVSPDAINQPFTRFITDQNDQFCARHAGLFSQRNVADPNGFMHPEIIHTTFDMEVTCNDGFVAMRTFDLPRATDSSLSPVDPSRVNVVQ